MPQLHRRILAGGGIPAYLYGSLSTNPFAPIQSSRISWHVGKRPSVRVWYIDPVYFFPRRIGTRIYEKTENRNAISCAGGAHCSEPFKPGCHVLQTVSKCVCCYHLPPSVCVSWAISTRQCYITKHTIRVLSLFSRCCRVFLNQTQRRKLRSPGPNINIAV